MPSFPTRRPSDLAQPEAGPDFAASLAARLQPLLPHYMVPAAIVAVNSLPTTPTGKTDLKLLSEQPLELPLSSAAGSGGIRERPTTPGQLLLAGIWTDLLSLAPEALALDDDVIAAGADSIRVMMFVGRARKRGIAVSAADVYRAPTVRALAAL